MFPSALVLFANCAGRLAHQIGLPTVDDDHGLVSGAVHSAGDNASEHDGESLRVIRKAHEGKGISTIFDGWNGAWERLPTPGGGPHWAFTTPDPDPSTAGGLEQLNRIAVGIFNLNLSSAGAHLHFISEAQTRLSQAGNERRQVPHLKKHTVPSAGLLFTAIGHGAGARGPGTAQNQLEAAN